MQSCLANVVVALAAIHVAHADVNFDATMKSRLPSASQGVDALGSQEIGIGIGIGGGFGPEPYPGPYPGPTGGWNHPGWSWDYHRYPTWWRPSMSFPIWIWLARVPRGYWQCTAFDESMQAYSAIGHHRDEAAYSALYACGGENFENNGCYVPNGYCRRR